MGRADRPIVLMAFANPTGDLIGIQKEIGAIKDIFHSVDDLVELQIDQRVELQGIRKSFQRARDRVVLFHFAGHAESTALMFETPGGDRQAISADNLARFLGTQESLDVVFLNGCSTERQASALIDAGAQCVIATTDKIDDTAAINFAKSFYEALTTGATIAKAFTEASESTQFDRNNTTRALFFGGAPPTTDVWSSELPWRIEYADESSRQWSLTKLARAAYVKANVSPADAKQHQQLNLLLQKVKSFWVGGVLSRSASGGLLRLSKESRPDAINQPWEGLKITPGEQPEVLGAGQRVFDVFANMHRQLLILGQPGSGKTTTLLELTSDLIEQADDNIAAGVPVIFHLSSFTDPQQPFATWLECELLDKYQIPRRIGSEWIEQERLILLLDGLDEVLPDCRIACVHAIHAFLEERLAQGICVCCRAQEFEDLNIKLDLSGAICLQPLTRQQILDFVENGGPEMASLNDILNRHEPLQDLAQSPLMLSIMSQAYSGIDADALQGEQFESLEGSRKHLFDTYIDKMFESPAAKDPPFERPQTVRWLSWLARKIDTESGSAIVQLEELQPSWLTRIGHRATFLIGLSLILTVLSTVFTALFWFGAGNISPDTLKGFVGPAGAEMLVQMHQGEDRSWSEVAWSAMWGGYPITAFIVFLYWFLAIGVTESMLPDFNEQRNATMMQTILQGLIKLVVFLLLWLPMAYLCAPRSGNESTGNNLFDIMMFTGLLASIVLGFYGRSFRCFSQIRSVETVGISWVSAMRGGFFGALVGFGFWVFAWLSWSREPNLVFWFRTAEDVQCVDKIVNGRTIETFIPCDGYMIFLIGFVLVGLVSGAIFGARIPKVIDQKTVPNQGIRLSIRNGLRSGLIVGLAIAVTVMVCVLLQNLEAKGLLSDRNALTVRDAFVMSLGCGLAGFYCAAMWFGGFAVVKHYLLRSVLGLFGYLPTNVPALLDHAARLDFMTRVGGGYIFNHRLLLDHFSAMASTDDKTIH